MGRKSKRQGCSVQALGLVGEMMSITWPKLNNSFRIIYPVDSLVRKTVFSAELYHSCFSRFAVCSER